MAIPAVEFHLFPGLPAELRDEIWSLCLPERICELDVPIDDIVFFEPQEKTIGPWPCELHHTSLVNKLPPLISRVCRESRAVAFKNGSIVQRNEESWPARGQDSEYWGSDLDLHDKWLDPARDSIHRNWNKACEPLWQYNYWGSPFPQFVEEVSKTEHVGSLMSNCLGHSYEWDHEIYDFPPYQPIFHTLYPEKLAEFQNLKRLPGLRIVMQVYVVHCDRSVAAQTGLFGLLGDAPIQILEYSEIAKLEALYGLAQTCEWDLAGAVSQRFEMEDEAAMKEKVRKHVMAQYHDKGLAAVARPAIMFRLCTRMCDHRGSTYARRGTRLEGGPRPKPDGYWENFTHTEY